MNMRENFFQNKKCDIFYGINQKGKCDIYCETEGVFILHFQIFQKLIFF